MTSEDQTKDARDGVIAALLAYLMWGVLPVYFKLTDHVAPLEVLAHRIIWSVVFGALIISVRRQWPHVRRALSNKGILGLLFLSSVLISANWLVYIWAVQDNQIFQTSLGYYINPLMYVLVGVVFFKDKLRLFQKIAVGLAFTGVLFLAIQGGRMPWIALFLAFAFTGYGVIRKKTVVAAMPGLFIETLMLLLPAVLYLLVLLNSGQSPFGFAQPSTSALLMLAGPVTVLPLMFFAIAARRLTLSTVGFLQFIAPTLQFLMGVLYGEQLTFSVLVCFIFIWLAAALYIYDIWSFSRKPGLSVNIKAQDK